MSEVPAWLDRFPVLAMHNAKARQQYVCGDWCVDVEVSISVRGGAINIHAHGLVGGIHEPLIDKSTRGSVSVMHMALGPGGLLAPTMAGALIPCPSVAEALELANDIVFNITASNEVVNG